MLYCFLAIADEPCFSKIDIDLIATELENSIKNVLLRVDIQHQLTWNKSLLEARTKKIQENAAFIDSRLRALQKKADNMHMTLYQSPNIKIQHLQPLDLNSGRPYVPTNPDEVVVIYVLFITISSKIPLDTYKCGNNKIHCDSNLHILFNFFFSNNCHQLVK